MIVSLLLYIGSLVFLILLFLWFGGASCGVNQFLISFTLVYTMAFTIISVTEWCEHGALLPSAVVTLYCYFLLFGGLSVDPSNCNTWKTDGLFQLVVGLVVSAFSICYAAWNLANSDSVLGNAGQKKAATHKQLNDEEQGDDPTPKSNSKLVSTSTKATSREDLTPKSKPSDDEVDEREMEDDAETLQLASKSAAKFHLLMAAAAMYMAMLLTNWGSRQQVESDSHDGAGSDTAYNLSVEAMWVKIVTNWVTAILYIWSLLAPYILTNRDFGSE